MRKLGSSAMAFGKRKIDGGQTEGLERSWKSTYEG